MHNLPSARFALLAEEPRGRLCFTTRERPNERGPLCPSTLVLVWHGPTLRPGASRPPRLTSRRRPPLVELLSHRPGIAVGGPGTARGRRWQKGEPCRRREPDRPASSPAAGKCQRSPRRSRSLRICGTSITSRRDTARAVSVMARALGRAEASTASKAGVVEIEEVAAHRRLARGGWCGWPWSDTSPTTWWKAF